MHASIRDLALAIALPAALSVACTLDVGDALSSTDSLTTIASGPAGDTGDGDADGDATDGDATDGGGDGSGGALAEVLETDSGDWPPLLHAALHLGVVPEVPARVHAHGKSARPSDFFSSNTGRQADVDFVAYQSMRKPPAGLKS